MVLPLFQQHFKQFVHNSRLFHRNSTKFSSTKRQICWILSENGDQSTKIRTDCVVESLATDCHWTFYENTENSEETSTNKSIVVWRRRTQIHLHSLTTNTELNRTERRAVVYDKRMQSCNGRWILFGDGSATVAVQQWYRHCISLFRYFALAGRLICLFVCLFSSGRRVFRVRAIRARDETD